MDGEAGRTRCQESSGDGVQQFRARVNFRADWAAGGARSFPRIVGEDGRGGARSRKGTQEPGRQREAVGQLRSMVGDMREIVVAELLAGGGGRTRWRAGTP